MHSTNYTNTLIQVAEDCPNKKSIIPPTRGTKKTIANLQYELLINHPYEYDSDHILFTVFAIRKEIPEAELEEQKVHFFSKGQPCFRASPLTKQYGWGVHANEKGKIALHGIETKRYAQLSSDQSIQKKKAMRSKKS